MAETTSELTQVSSSRYAAPGEKVPTAASDVAAASNDVSSTTPFVFEELPSVIKSSLRMASLSNYLGRSKYNAVIMLLAVSGVWSHFLALWQLTSSLEVAVFFYVLFALNFVVPLFTSVDFSSENTFAVRELLRLDRGSVVRLAKLAKREQRYMWIGNGSLIILAAIFGVAPFAASDAWGKHTFAITIGTCLVSLVCFVALFVVVVQAWSLTSVLLRAWGRRVKRYVVKMRDILLNDELEEGSPSVAKRLSTEQEINEAWARENIRRLAPWLSGNLATTFCVIVACLIVLANRPGTEEKRVHTIVVLTFSATFWAYYFVSNCRVAAYVNLKWNRLSLRYLNDAEIQQRLIAMKWTLERWRVFMDNHVINSQVAFGVKVTVQRMRAVAGFVASAFFFVLYFILRDEVRELTGGAAAL